MTRPVVPRAIASLLDELVIVRKAHLSPLSCSLDS